MHEALVGLLILIDPAIICRQDAVSSCEDRLFRSDPQMEYFLALGVIPVFVHDQCVRGLGYLQSPVVAVLPIDMAGGVLQQELELD